MADDVVLIAGTKFFHETVNGAVSTWNRVPRMKQIGAIGEKSDPKDKTTLEDEIKKYGSGLRDAADKNLKLQYIPFQEEGDEFYDDYVLQQAFITRARNEEEFNVRVDWPAGETNGFLLKTLGFEWDEGTQEDYKMATISGKQNSRVVYSLLAPTGTLTVAVAGTTQLTPVTVPTGINTDLGTVYWSSSDVAIATVSASGLVTGAGAGTANITAEFRGVVSAVAAVVVS
ncbi:unnamed protein product [marine sediment metagenome]|uniref:BIG2 domain-containing protein n=1 Tax=marine sediment metagenome TaxID=412755 RepID=X1SSS6_9ZZZZ